MLLIRLTPNRHQNPGIMKSFDDDKPCCRKDSAPITQGGNIMRINTNIAALNTYNQYTVNNSAANKSIEKLSSGYRINSASDDAAGLAISEKMRSQIRGLDQASRNSQDGISMVQTAEGALEETEEILQRMRELSVQASNDTYTADDKTAIQSEIDQLVEEIDRISNDTEFNNKTLLDGSLDVDAQFTTNAASIATVDVDASVDEGTYTIEIASSSEDITATGTNTTVLDNADITATAAGGADFGEYTLEITDDGAGTYTISLYDSDGESIDELNSIDLTAASATQAIGDFTVDLTNGGADDVTAGIIEFNYELTADFTLTNGSTGSQTAVSVAGATSGEVEVGEFTFTVDETMADGTSAIEVTDNSVSLQIGANAGQKIDIAISEMSSTALAVNSVDVTTEAGAESAIEAIDAAITSVSSERASLGAVQNRLEHTINNLTTASENLTASESRIRDVDIAAEMMEYTTKNVLQQSAQSMLAQANSQPESVLQLLR